MSGGGKDDCQNYIIHINTPGTARTIQPLPTTNNDENSSPANHDLAQEIWHGELPNAENKVEFRSRIVLQQKISMKNAALIKVHNETETMATSLRRPIIFKNRRHIKIKTQNFVRRQFVDQ